LAIDVASLQDIYKLSNRWVIAKTTITMNIFKCVLKGFLIQVSGVEELKTTLHISWTAVISICHPFYFEGE
jgi:hypothetical protein